MVILIFTHHKIHCFYRCNSYSLLFLFYQKYLFFFFILFYNAITDAQVSLQYVFKSAYVLVRNYWDLYVT